MKTAAPKEYGYEDGFDVLEDIRQNFEVLEKHVFLKQTDGMETEV